MPQHRMVYTGPSSIRGDDNDMVQPYTVFTASARWLKRHVGIAHRLPTVEEYRDTVLGARWEQLVSMVSQRGFKVSDEREPMIRALLDKIVKLPDELPGEGESLDDLEVYDGEPDWAKAGSQDVRQEATRRGLPVAGVDLKTLRRQLQDRSLGELDKSVAGEPPATADTRGELALAPAAQDDSWRAPLREAHEAGDYVSARRLLKEHKLGEPENGSKKAVLAAAALALGMEG